MASKDDILEELSAKSDNHLSHFSKSNSGAGIIMRCEPQVFYSQRKQEAGSSKDNYCKIQLMILVLRRKNFINFRAINYNAISKNERNKCDCRMVCIVDPYRRYILV